MSEAKLDSIIERLSDHGEILARLDERSAAQDSRIETTEEDVKVLQTEQKATSKKLNRIAGAGAAVVTGISALFGFGE